MQTLNKIWFIQLVWWLSWATFHGWFLMQLGWNATPAFTDSIISNVLLAAICSGVLFSVRYNRPEKNRIIYLIAGIILSTALWVWLSGQLISEISGEDSAYLEFLENSRHLRFLSGIFIITLFAMIGWIAYFLKEQADDKNRHFEINRMAKDSELIHLRQQLQPHFLFNTLNSVSALIGSNPAAAKTMVNQLSEFLRGTLNKEDHKMVSLKEELDYLGLYLAIEKVRFGDRLQTELVAEGDAGEKEIPVFLLQPLVENAIKFGLYDTLDNVNIEIHSRYTEPYLLIRITNPFDAATGNMVPGTGFGLNAVSRRLFLLFNRNDLLEISSADSIFTVVLKIPQQND